ncbi:10212_t:CDS:2, partial [Paraglomus occultum]
MDAKQEQMAVLKDVLEKTSDNYLYDYLKQREGHASFNNCHLEHSWYFNNLKVFENDSNFKDNALIAKDRFEVYSSLVACGTPASSKQEHPLVEKKSVAVSGFWKRIDEEQKQREEEKAAVRMASLGHLNIFGRLTTYEPQIRRNLVTQDSDDVLGEHNNQEEVEVIRDVERESKTNGSLVSSVVMREVSSSFLPKQPRDEEAEVLSASVTKSIESSELQLNSMGRKNSRGFCYHELIMSPPRPTYNVSRPSPVVRGKQKLRNLPEDRPHLRIRLHNANHLVASTRRTMMGRILACSSDDDGNDIGIDFESNIFTENNEKGGSMLETGDKI